MQDRKFEVRCDAMPDGQLQVKSKSLSVSVSQMIDGNKSEEMWQSVLVICDQGDDGSLTTKVIVCHPDWDQNLQIACIRSSVSGERNQATPPLEIDLKPSHV